MSMPNTYTEKNDTGCCAVPNIAEWDEKEVTFIDKPFIRMHTKSIFYVPINMSRVMTKIQKQAEDANSNMSPQEAMILSRDLSPWKAEQLYAVNSIVDGADNVSLSGHFLTKVFEGPYKNAKNWYKTLLDYSESVGKKANNVYFFYTTCPKCAKHYGKNYTIGLIQVF